MPTRTLRTLVQNAHKNAVCVQRHRISREDAERVRQAEKIGGAAGAFTGFAGNSLQGAALNMKRRVFIRVALGVAAGAAAAPACLLANPSDAEIIEQNYEAFRQRLIRLASQGHEIKNFWLARPQDGFRSVTLFTSTETLTFLQPWRGEAW